MKTKNELLKMTFCRLAELEEMQEHYKKEKPALLEQLKIELSLLYDILGEEIPEEYWERIENII